MSKKKPKDSHKYFDPKMLSQPGIIYCKAMAKMYEETDEQCLEELKAKNFKYIWNIYRKKKHVDESSGTSKNEILVESNRDLNEEPIKQDGLESISSKTDEKENYSVDIHQKGIPKTECCNKTCETKQNVELLESEKLHQMQMDKQGIQISNDVKPPPATFSNSFEYKTHYQMMLDDLDMTRNHDAMKLQSRRPTTSQEKLHEAFDEEDDIDDGFRKIQSCKKAVMEHSTSQESKLNEVCDVKHDDMISVDDGFKKIKSSKEAIVEQHLPDVDNIPSSNETLSEFNYDADGIVTTNRLLINRTPSAALSKGNESCSTQSSAPSSARNNSRNNSSLNIGAHHGSQLWAPSPTVTMCTRGAAKKVANMFSAALDEDPDETTDSKSEFEESKITNFFKETPLASSKNKFCRADMSDTSENEFKDCDDSDLSFENKFSKKTSGTGIPVFNVFKDETLDTEKPKKESSKGVDIFKDASCMDNYLNDDNEDKLDASFENKFSKKTSGTDIPAFEIYKDKTLDIEKPSLTDRCPKKESAKKFEIFKDASCMDKDSKDDNEANLDASFENQFIKKPTGRKEISFMPLAKGQNVKSREEKLFQETPIISKKKRVTDLGNTKDDNRPSKVFELFKDLTENDGKNCDDLDSSFENQFCKKTTGIPTFEIYKDTTVDLIVNNKNEDGVSKRSDMVNMQKIISKSDSNENNDEQTEIRLESRKFELDMTLAGTPGAPNYESTAVFPLRKMQQRNNNQNSVNLTINEIDTCMVDLKNINDIQKSSKSDQMDIEKVLPVEEKQGTNDIAFDKELSSEKNVLSDIKNTKEEDFGFGSIQRQDKMEHNLPPSNDRSNDQKKVDAMSNLCNFELGDNAKQSDLNSLVLKDQSEHVKNYDISKETNVAADKGQSFSKSKGKKRRSSSIGDLDHRESKKVISKQFQDLSNFDEFEEDTNMKTPNLFDFKKSVSKEKMFQQGGGDNFEQLFQKKSGDRTSKREEVSINKTAPKECENTDFSFPGYSACDETGFGKINGEKRRNTSCLDEETVDNDHRKCIKRFVSTPSSPSHNHRVTFGQQISELSMKVNFEKTDNSHLCEETDVKLSPIVELSNEDSKGSRRSGSGSGEDIDETKGSTSVSCKKNLFITYDESQLLSFTKRVLPVIYESENVMKLDGPLPKLKSDSMTLNIGQRNVRVVKCVKKYDSHSIYHALIDERQEVFIKCLEEDSPAFYPCIWDVYVSNEIHKRISGLQAKDFLPNQDITILKKFLKHNFMCMFSDSVYVESSYITATVMDTVNLYKKHGAMMDEALAMLYAYEILTVIHALHKVNIIHGDLKPNAFLQLDGEMTDKGPLSFHSIMLGEFGKSIDISLIPGHEKIMFVGSDIGNRYQSSEMLEGKSWKYNIDYYAAAATIHFIAFQSEMETYYDKNFKLKRISKAIPAHWNLTIWEKLFCTLINTHSTSFDILGIISKLADELVDENTVMNLKEARLKTSDYLMDDDDDF